LAQLQSNLFFLGIRSTPVTEAKLISTSQVQGTNSFTEKLKRLQASYFNPSSAIRIDSFENPTGRDLVVYIPGTQSNQLAGENVFNIGSNISSMTSTELAASEIAVRRSLENMQVGENDRVILIGHSQGGIIASNIAISDDYDVAGLISVGAQPSVVKQTQFQITG
jgi:pimeloyl-ACP methyl ester carboxylesterase